MRSTKNGQFGWYEKEAMKKIETLSFKMQASCKLIYISICSLSSKNGNSEEVECYKFDISRCASVSEKTVQRYLKELESLGIIGLYPQDRKSDGKYEKIKIWLKDNTSTVGQFGDSSETVRRQFGDTESDIYKENKKERKKEIINSINTITEQSSDFEKKQITKDIDELIQNIKTFLFSHELEYNKEDERNFARHILTAKEFGEACKRSNLTREEYAIGIIHASLCVDFWKGKINGPKSIYQKYSKVYNDYMVMKAKNKNNTFDNIKF